VNQIPEGDEESVAALVGFIRVACTTTAADPASRAEVAWDPINPLQSDELFEWCQGLQNQYYSQLGATVNEHVAVAAAPPTASDHMAEYAVMVAAAIDASHGNAEKSKKGKFSASFVAEYAVIAGIEEPDPCDSSIMTPFYQGLEEHKGNRAEARKHIEKCFGPKTSGNPDAPREMTSVLTTETISAFRNMDLTADDTFVAFLERLKGFSLFSVAPAPVHLIQKAREGRAKCMEHELSEYPKQDEISRANKVSTNMETWPLSQDRVVDWVLQFKRIGGIAFGPKFILRPLLDKLLIAMQGELQWQAITKIGCMTLAWAIHKGIRAALGPNRNFAFLKQVVVEFAIGRAPKLADMEEDIQARIMMAAGGNAGMNAAPARDNTNSGKHGLSGQPSANNPNKQGKFEYGTNISGPAFTKAWEADVDEVKASKGRSFKGRDFCGSQQKIQELFGPEFTALSSSGGHGPCMSYFILGRCHDKCPRSHTLASEPDQNILSGMQSRIKGHCKLLQQAKNS
jgi:hypothetical protein